VRLLAWVFAAMVFWVPPRPTNVPQLGAYVRIAHAITAATSDPEEAALLAAIGSLESGYSPTAVGKLGEVGVWQLMPPAPSTLVLQAKEALRRIHAQGMCGYTGEAADPHSKCPLAHNRLARASNWVEAHPFLEEESPEATR
jgi:Transglycosylase SLT domain